MRRKINGLSGKRKFKSNFCLLCIFVFALFLQGLTVYANPNIPEGYESKLAFIMKNREELGQFSEVVSIQSAEDLLNLSRECSVEVYSKGKLFVLENDIDLEGTAFKNIPVFSGTFLGQNHSITGFKITGSASNQGFFRYIEKTGRVYNLHIEGVLEPEGSGKNIGGITGVNRGHIEACSFRGSGVSLENMGGIAGVNEEGAVILDSVNTANLTGNLSIGGIVGKNQGSISNVENYGQVNKEQAGIENTSTELSITVEEISETLRSERVNDIGGIAGYSEGNIQESRNYGDIGLAHAGYNVGGIVGRQAGAVSDCQNYGSIEGRKDIGGITGQLIPYLSRIYSEDSLDRLDVVSDELANRLEELNDEIETSVDQLSNNISSIGESLEGIRDILRARKENARENYDQMDSDISAELDVLKDELDKVDLDLGSARANQLRSNILRNINSIEEILVKERDFEGIDSLDALTTTYEEIYAELSNISNLSQEIARDFPDYLEETGRGIRNGIEDFEDSVEDVMEAGDSLMGVVESWKDIIADNIKAFDEELTPNLDELYDKIDIIGEDLEDSKDSIRDSKDSVSNQMDAIRDTLSEGRERVDTRVSELSDGIYYRDLSANITTTQKGVLLRCENQGSIYGDEQVGGIVGTANVEISFLPDTDIQSIDTEGSRSFRANNYLVASIRESRNTGHVLAESRYAGGIVGMASVGACVSNQNFAMVKVVDGDYAAGIAGMSTGSLIGNESMGEVHGRSYLGGIAGLGKDMERNAAMVQFYENSGELLGSIAGAKEEDGKASENFYVSEGIGAIDGISLESEADALSYQDFLERGVSSDFSTLSIRFYADDVFVDAISVSYGESISKDRFPEIPEKAGYYGEWEVEEISPVLVSRRIDVVYRELSSTIAYKTEEGKTLALSEGSFSGNANLALEELSIEERNLSLPSGYEAVSAYRIGVDELMEETKLRFRLNVGDTFGTIQIAKIGETEATILDSQRDGNFLVFDMENQGSILVLRKVETSLVRILLIVLVSMLSLLGIAYLVKVMKKRSKERSRARKRL